jgi:tRNA threonylcarbamoyladenosine biosynthesis protein TsaB
MKLLIDSSSQYRFVGLFENETLLELLVEQGNNNHSKYLLPQIDRLLSNHNLTPSDLEAVYVGQGPGSYTGVRIAVTIAKTFALECKIPLFSFDSLSLYATAFQGMVAVSIPMKRQIVLGAVYDVQDRVEVVHQPNYYSLEEWNQKCGMARAIEPFEVSIVLSKLPVMFVEKPLLFGPEYAREWTTS